ncbi:MAG: hypothetical protein IJ833_08715 [Lachnospiraceae bacterium]|nr:hypothetical protein [Lachnospiraceae bacterium]
MHIAICDDNVADRKQLERLLKRESDKRAQSSGILYTDSFGNADSLLSNPMQYDLFYIDMCKTEGVTGIDVVHSLFGQGVNAPVVLCCSDIDYRTEDLPENVLFLNKPIKVDELSASIDHALTIRSQAEPLIELREDGRTLYVTEPEIYYAVEDGQYMVVTLSEGRSIRVSTTIENLFSQLEWNPNFLSPSTKTILNGRHIEKLGFRKATMIDGTVFKIHKACMEYAEEVFRVYHS